MMKGLRTKASISHYLHDCIFTDCSQSFCSRAYEKHELDWRWAAFRATMDFLFRPFGPDHCLECYRFHHKIE